MHIGGGWGFVRSHKVVVNVYKYIPARGVKSYIPPPTSLAGKHAIINVQDEDQNCFMWSILATLYPAQTHVQHAMKYLEHVAKLNCQILEFPVKHTSQRITHFENVNNVSINIYKYDAKYKAAPLRISNNQSRERVVHLILIEDDEGNTHYTLLENISALMYGGVGHKTNLKRFVCRRCLTAFNTESKLEIHKEICTDKGFIQRNVFPKEEDKSPQIQKK